MSDQENQNTTPVTGESEQAGQIQMTEQQKKSQRARNIAIALVLVGFVVLVYVGTWAKLGANVMVRPL